MTELPRTADEIDVEMLSDGLRAAKGALATAQYTIAELGAQLRQRDETIARLRSIIHGDAERIR